MLKEFKEKFLYYQYKDKEIKNVPEFNNMVYVKYKFMPSSKLVENILFYQYKDKPLGSSELFRKNIYKNHKYNPSKKLYRDIVNYQVKTFGHFLEYGRHIIMTTNSQKLQKKKKRDRDRAYSKAYYQEQVYLEKLEKKKRK